MASYEYSPVGLPSSDGGGGGGNAGHDRKHSFFRLFLVAPMYHFLLDPVGHLLPTGVLSAAGKGATLWRKLLSQRPFRKIMPMCVPVLKEITVAHMLLSIPLLYFLIMASDLGLLQPTSHHALKRTGKLTSYAMMGAFLTSSKSHSLVSLLTGLSFERLMSFHLASALLTLWMALLHGVQIAYYHRGDESSEEHHHDDEHDDHDHDHHHDHDDHDDHDHDDHDHSDDGHRSYYFRRILHHHDSIHSYLGPDPNPWKFYVDGSMNISGSIVLASLVVVIATSVFHRLFRKWFFEGWLIFHVTGVLMILIAGKIHGADVFLFAIIWWALDLFIRYGIMATCRYPHRAQVTRVSENVTKIQWNKTEEFHYEAGQFVQIAVPSVKMWEFHPISIASAPEDATVTLYVRALPGTKTWTRQLYDLAKPRDENKISTSTVRIFLEGPYGSVPSVIENPNQYSMAVFISGGIGVTPCHSIAKRLISSQEQYSLHKLWYIWAIRDEGIIKAVPPPTLEKQEESGVASFGKTAEGNNDDENGIELVERGHQVEPKGDDDRSATDGNNQDSLADASAHSPLTVQTDIYVTQMTKFLDDGYDGDEGDKGAMHDDPIERDGAFPYTIHEGRPNVVMILNEVQAEAIKKGYGRIFVMGCGPISLLEDLQAACRASQTDNLQIDFHQEIFDY